MRGHVVDISFQHPTFGFPCRAKFCAGVLSIEVFSNAEEEAQYATELEDARASAKTVSGRYRSLDAATDALQRFGVDTYAEGGWETSRW